MTKCDILETACLVVSAVAVSFVDISFYPSQYLRGLEL